MDINAETIFVSIGENCLTEDILQRHGKKSFSSPYSHGRSNLDYAIKLENENYIHLMDIEHLIYDEIWGKTVVKNKHEFTSDSIYLNAHSNGFEFTHHDVIKNQSHRESYERKISRLVRYKGKKNFHFYYHHRLNKNTDLDLLFSKAKTFINYYQVDNKKCEFTIFMQEIIDISENRGVKIIKYSKNISAYIFKTLHIWGGSDQEIFWARNDDDLIKVMFNTDTFSTE